MLAAVEGSAARIVRVDPRDGSEVTEADLPDLLGRQWGMPVGYVIAAYNDMAKVRDPDGGEALLIGLEAFIPMRAPIAAGHSVVNVGYGRLEAGGWYLVRHPNGSYELRQVGAALGRALVAIRSIRVSPFPEEGQAVYFAGYDANKAPAHDTAWIFRSTTARRPRSRASAAARRTCRARNPVPESPRRSLRISEHKENDGGQRTLRDLPRA